ncbi:M23 peptidase domain-containing protein [Myxococcus stipitatus DSM 14675]|uniref:M23 peptidase domain-containing protein n=1 Tax=Myxococcus stipitatus (strain DSM 14675 / JCM 12634 / Mx s8) TaxID=1278073 RepID=L7U8N4_MYXSD|nr:M23 family metallopeptidase [Myxococcus stipitatus]AGC44433.1 M23 peptidase domain-containing protein [Myxococcus stipitatus DSM 14675]
MASLPARSRYSLSSRWTLALLALGASAQAAEPSSATPVAVAVAQARPQLSLHPGSARPGDPVMVAVRGLAGMPTGTLAGRPLKFFAWGEGFLAVTGLSVELAPGSAMVHVEAPALAGGAPVELAGTLDVVEPGYPARELKVSGKYVEPPASVRTRIAADKRAFAAAFDQPFSSPHFAQNFVRPRQDRITAPFGDKRTFNGKLSSQHFGVDLDGDPGAPVMASNEGTVVMTRDNYAAGKTVLIHHGADLYTSYFHLSRIHVKNGAKVTQGQRIGEVGSTGRVTGPHLHWGVKVGGRWVDGESLLRLDFFPTPPAMASGETGAGAQ